jgi:hypothetical protein
MRNWLAGLLFGLAPLRRVMADTLSEISIGYPDSPLNGPHGAGGPAPGERAPPVAGQMPVGAGDRPRFALFAAPGTAADRLIHKYPELLEAAVRPPFEQGGMWLVRPDGYLAASAKEDEESLEDYLDALVGAGARQREAR